MRGTFDIHPEPHEFEAEVKVHAIGVPFSTITLSVGDFRLNVYGKADDALKLIRAAKLLNEVFASEKVEAGE